MKCTIDEHSEINGFYPDDYPEIPECAFDITEEQFREAMDYQSRGLAMCVTNGVITGEQRPNQYSHWSAEGKWVEGAEKKMAFDKDRASSRIAEIDSRLDQIDIKMIRCIDEIQSGDGLDGKAAEQRSKLKTEKTELRKEREALVAVIEG